MARSPSSTPPPRRCSGYKQEEMLGRTCINLIHHTRADGTPYPAADSPIRKSLTNFDTVRVANEIFWRKDGTSFPSNTSPDRRSIRSPPIRMVYRPSASSSPSPTPPSAARSTA